MGDRNIGDAEEKKGEEGRANGHSMEKLKRKQKISQSSNK